MQIFISVTSLQLHQLQMFRLDVVVEGIPLTTDEMNKQLQFIVKEVEEFEGADPPAIGIMTGDNRRTWAQNRQILVGGEFIKVISAI